MSEIERRKKSNIKGQLSFFREAWMLIVGILTVVGILVAFLINYGIVYPMVKSEIDDYHIGFTNQDGIVLKTKMDNFGKVLEEVRTDVKSLLTKR